MPTCQRVKSRVSSRCAPQRILSAPIDTFGEVGGSHFPFFFRGGGGLPCLWKKCVCSPSSFKQSNVARNTMATSTAQPQHCNQDCGFKFQSCTGSSAGLWWCVDCSTRICDGCWPGVPGHRDGATARDGQPHEKTDSRRHDRLREILNPPVTEDELERLHAADLETTWFGKLASSTSTLKT
jgi:hypothetical protein